MLLDIEYHMYDLIREYMIHVYEEHHPVISYFDQVLDIHQLVE